MSQVVLATTERRRASELPIVITAGIGLFLSTLDTGIINVALPTLQHSFHVSVATVTWAVTVYLLALTSTIIVFGRLSDRFGRVRIYSGGLVVFAVASLLCGLSNSAFALICFRGVQGIGAAMMQATATAIITTFVAPDRKGAALGSLGMMIGLGPVLGPGLGGLLLSFSSWRWMFLLNIPICVIGLYGCLRLSKVKNEPRQKISIDYIGNVLLSLAILSVLYGLSSISREESVGEHIVPFALFVVFIGTFIRWEIRAAHPMIPLSLFKQPQFRTPMLAVTVLGTATAITFIMPPFFLEQALREVPWQVGMVNLMSPLGLVLFSQLSGRSIVRWGTTRLMAVGLGLMLMALILLSFLNGSSGGVIIGCYLLLYGVGAGVFVPPNLAAIMGAVGVDLQGTIGAVQRMVQNIGIATGASVAATIIQIHETNGTVGMVHAFRDTWIFASVIVCLSLVTVTRLRVGRSAE